MDISTKHEVVKILISDQILVENVSRFCSSLSLPESDFMVIKKKYEMGIITSFELFSKILDMWESKFNLGLTQLIQILRSEEFLQVAETLQQKFEVTISKTVYIGVGATTNHFSGRTAELSILEENCKSSKITLITGMGGIGKSELAKNFANSKQSQMHCIWLDGESEGSLYTSVTEVAKITLGKSFQNSDAKSQPKISEIFYNVLNKLENFLLIVDNVDKENQSLFEILDKIRDSGYKIPVIITSRNLDALTDAGEQIDLDILDDLAAQQLVKESMDSEENLDDVKQLCRILDNFPLALQQAIGFIKSQKRLSLQGRGYNISDYIQFYEEKKESYLSYSLNKFEHKYKLTTFVTWDISINKIKEDAKHGDFAISLINLMAYLDPVGIQVDFLESIYQKIYSEVDIMEPVQLIKEYCLIKVDNCIISIHRLVQEIVRMKVGRDGEMENEILTKLVNVLEVEEITKRLIQHYIKICEHCFQKKFIFENSISFPFRVTNKMMELSLYHGALNFALKTNKSYQKVLGELHIGTFASLGQVGHVEMLMGEYDKALEKLDYVSQRIEPVLGLDHKFTAVNLLYKANTLYYLKRSEEAKDVLNILEKAKPKADFSEDIMENLEINDAVAYLWMQLNCFDKALFYYVSIKKIKDRYLGVRHPSTLITMSNMAMCMSQKGEKDKAVSMLEKIDISNVELPGEDHVDTLVGKVRWARCLTSVGRNEEALILFREILTLRERSLGPQHPETVRTLKMIEVLEGKMENATSEIGLTEV